MGEVETTIVTQRFRLEMMALRVRLRQLRESDAK
jgi:hypothetical protein